ncbi:hypothetical protein PCAR4_830026 [Paraburkholderia caribensis]|nr:hypothetical protein PCAR4_830026 [Paraburkholderia caribensis]
MLFGKHVCRARSAQAHLFYFYRRQVLGISSGFFGRRLCHDVASVTGPFTKPPIQLTVELFARHRLRQASANQVLDVRMEEMRLLSRLKSSLLGLEFKEFF